MCDDIKKKKRVWPDLGFTECKICGTPFHKASATNKTCPFCVVNYKKSSFFIFERDDFRCVYCGRSSIEDGVELHVDHIFPKSMYGLNHPINMVTACKKCNYAKGPRELSSGVVARLWERNAVRNKRLYIDIEQLIKIFDIKYENFWRKPT